MKNLRTNLAGFVLIFVGAALIFEARHVTAEAIAVISAGAGFFSAADAKP